MGFARRPQSQPYGIVAVNDVIWYSETGVAPNTVVRFDPKDGKISDLENSFGRRRRAQREFDKRRNIAIACSGVNRIGFVKLN
jgi:virginiamycin B lyase